MNSKIRIISNHLLTLLIMILVCLPNISKANQPEDNHLNVPASDWTRPLFGSEVNMEPDQLLSDGPGGSAGGHGDGGPFDKESRSAIAQAPRPGSIQYVVFFKNQEPSKDATCVRYHRLVTNSCVEFNIEGLIVNSMEILGYFQKRVPFRERTNLSTAPLEAGFGQ